MELHILNGVMQCLLLVTLLYMAVYMRACKVGGTCSALDIRLVNIVALIHSFPFYL